MVGHCVGAALLGIAQATALWQIAGGAVLGCAVFAVLGVAVGTLLRNQIAAILLILVDGKHTVAQILARGQAFHADAAAFDRYPADTEQLAFFRIKAAHLAVEH